MPNDLPAPGPPLGQAASASLQASVGQGGQMQLVVYPTVLVDAATGRTQPALRDSLWAGPGPGGGVGRCTHSEGRSCCTAGRHRHPACGAGWRLPPAAAGRQTCVKSWLRPGIRCNAHAQQRNGCLQPEKQPGKPCLNTRASWPAAPSPHWSGAALGSPACKQHPGVRAGQQRRLPGRRAKGSHSRPSAAAQLAAAPACSLPPRPGW